MYTMIVEQTKSYSNRMTYDSENHIFTETPYKFMALERGCTLPYGWIKETGTPPDEHLDVYLVDDEEPRLGEQIKICVVGVFIRNDGDHKFVAVKQNSGITSFSRLPEYQKNMLRNVYPKLGSGEGWYDEAIAIEVLDAFIKR